MSQVRFLVPFLVVLFVLFALSTEGRSREILVGGHQVQWKVPNSNQTLNEWAGRTRFKVGDVLVWQYDSKTDSVLEVTKEDYDSCKTSSPIKEHKNANTKIELTHSGPFYFISGAQGNCEKGEKLIIVVLSEDHWRKSDNYPSSSPSAAPAPAQAPTSAVNEPAGGHKGDASGLRSRVFGTFLGLGALVGAVLM